MGIKNTLKFLGMLGLMFTAQRTDAVSASLRGHELSNEPATERGIESVIEFMSSHKDMSQGLIELSEVLGSGEQVALSTLQRDLETLEAAASERRKLLPLDCPTDFCLLPGNLPLYVDVNNKNANTIRLTMSESVDGRIHDNAILGFLIHTKNNGDIKIQVGPGVSSQAEYQTFKLKCPLKKFDNVEVVFVSPTELKITVTNPDDAFIATQTFTPPSEFDGLIDVVGGGIDSGPSYLMNVRCRVAASASNTVTQTPTTRSGTGAPTSASTKDVGTTKTSSTKSPTISKDIADTANTTQAGQTQGGESGAVVGVVITGVFLLGLAMGVKNKEYINKLLKYIKDSANFERMRPPQAASTTSRNFPEPANIVLPVIERSVQQAAPPAPQIFAKPPQRPVPPARTGDQGGVSRGVPVSPFSSKQTTSASSVGTGAEKSVRDVRAMFEKGNNGKKDGGSTNTIKR